MQRRRSETGQPDKPVGTDSMAASNLLAHEEGDLVQAHRRGGLADGQVDQTGGQLMQALALEPALERVRYRQQTDGQVFELDTGDLTEEVGPGGLSDPAILTWLREYVNEGVESTGAVQ